MKPQKNQDIVLTPTPDGAGLEVDLPAPANTEHLAWLGEELQKVIAYIDQLPQQRPEGKAERSPIYAAGLRDMAQWILKKVQKEIDWQALRCFVGDEVASELPEHGSSFDLAQKAGRK